MSGWKKGHDNKLGPPAGPPWKLLTPDGLFASLMLRQISWATLALGNVSPDPLGTEGSLAVLTVDCLLFPEG